MDANMLYEPDTVWGRTQAGDHEVAVPKSGLSLAQRRLLARLTPPRPFTALAAKLKVDPPRLENELLRLAQLELVAFQRPGSPYPRTAPRIDLPLPKLPPAPVLPTMVQFSLGILAFVLGAAVVLVVVT